MRVFPALAAAALLLSACAADDGGAVAPAGPSEQAVTSAVPAQAGPSEQAATPAAPAEQVDARTWFEETCPTQVVVIGNHYADYGLVSGVVSVPQEEIPSTGARIYAYDELNGVMIPKEMLTPDTPMCLSPHEGDERVVARDSTTGEEDNFYPVTLGPDMPSPAYIQYSVPKRLALNEDFTARNARYSSMWDVHPYSDVAAAAEDPVEDDTDVCQYHGVECGG